ncbi:hypothetical protein HK102_009595, partial [Quaeritorhiza haematococci]
PPTPPKAANLQRKLTRQPPPNNDDKSNDAELPTVAFMGNARFGQTKGTMGSPYRL